MEEVDRLVREQRVPVMIRADDGSVADLILNLPRQSYIHHLVDHLQTHLSLPSAPSLFFQTIPLKLHHPVGVIYDLFRTDEELFLILSMGAGPDERVLSLEETRGIFMNTLKEADFLMHGNTSAVMSLAKDDQSKLWASIGNGNPESVQESQSIQKKLMSSSSPLKHIPIRLYFHPTSTTISVWQEPIPIRRTSDGTPQTIRHVLDLANASNMKAWCHGVGLEEEMQVEWLWRRAWGPDLFLHVTVREWEGS